MKRRTGCIWLLLILFSSSVFGQTDTLDAKRFSHYLEDQLFFNLSYIAIRHLHPDLTQQGFSHSVSFGFIRDIPVNLRRNLGFGLGVGYERDIFYQNLRISVSESDGSIQYTILDPGSYLNNAFVIKKIVFPVEFRYRNSDATRFRFFRIYAGTLIGYTVGAESHYETDKVSVDYRKLTSIPNRWQWGVYLYAGYGELNGYIYYGLNDLFSPQVKFNGTHVPMYDLKFGVMLSFL
ncbi:MAG: PorT family protein [Chlorobi bacterium]|nr:PorT family protein [Chlorobiota bacterium]